MSAHIVDEAHIDVLVDAAWQYRGNGIDALSWCWETKPGNSLRQRRLEDLTKTELGRMLLAENARSVSTCYSESEDPVAILYTHRPTQRQFSPSQVLKALGGYRYQACESDDWRDTEAFAFCERLQHNVLLVAFPDGPNDHWEWTDAKLGRSLKAAS